MYLVSDGVRPYDRRSLTCSPTEAVTDALSSQQQLKPFHAPNGGGVGSIQAPANAAVTPAISAPLLNHLGPRSRSVIRRIRCSSVLNGLENAAIPRLHRLPRLPTSRSSDPYWRVSHRSPARTRPSQSTSTASRRRPAIHQRAGFQGMAESITRDSQRSCLLHVHHEQPQ